MLVQAIHLESPYITDPAQTMMYVAGFVSRARIQQQAMRIPLAWLVVVWLPVAVLFLALPFIKLATMQSKERFSAVNLLLLAIGTIALRNDPHVSFGLLGRMPLFDFGGLVATGCLVFVLLISATQNAVALARLEPRESPVAPEALRKSGHGSTMAVYGSLGIRHSGDSDSNF